MDRDEFSHRLRVFQRGEHLALAIGALPLLAIYVAVHTRGLKPLLQDHKHLMVALVIALPLAWLVLAVRGWKRIGARWLGLHCPQCGQEMATQALPPAPEPLRCPSCGTEVVPAARTPR